MHPTDDSKCQDLADTARAATVQAMRYRSARDPKRLNIAVLSCAAFASREPLDRQTWRMHLGSSGVQAICNGPLLRLELERGAFARDSRSAALRRER